MKIKRFETNPIITPDMDGRMGDNINGPSLIRVPDWLPNPLGKYYLYFAHHQGKYIRMAYADSLEGPWKMYEPGVLALENAYFRGHVASPDVHVDEAEHRIRMYYHGMEAGQGQKTRVAVSPDGIAFTARPEILGDFYFRVVEHSGWYYAVARSGKCYRSKNPLSGFEAGPQISDGKFRHNALMVDGDRLLVFYSMIGDCPEHIVMSTLDLAAWPDWKMSDPISVLRPENAYEGSELPLVASRTGWAPKPMHEVRDPAIYRGTAKPSCCTPFRASMESPRQNCRCDGARTPLGIIFPVESRTCTTTLRRMRRRLYASPPPAVNPVRHQAPAIARFRSRGVLLRLPN